MKRCSLGSLPVPCFALVVFVALVAACTLAEDVPAVEVRASEINSGLMCPVCPGESIDQSQNALAVQMRGVVIEKLQQGWTEGQIREFFTERYGPSVLMEPPREGFDLVAWVLPPVGVAIGVVVLFFILRRMRARPPEVAGAVEQFRITNEEREEYQRRIEAALDYDGSEKLEEPTVRTSGSNHRSVP